MWSQASKLAVEGAGAFQLAKTDISAAVFSDLMRIGHASLEL